MTSKFLDIVDNIIIVDSVTLQESQEISNTSAQLVTILFTNVDIVLYMHRILEAVEFVSAKIPITNTSEPVVISQTSFAISVQQVDFQKFSRDGQTFSINNRAHNQSSLFSGLTFGDSFHSQPTGSISLPNNLLDSTIPKNTTRITNAVFLSDSLFLRRDNEFAEVGSVIISASVLGVGMLKDLNPPVSLMFQIDSVSTCIVI